MRRLGKSSCAVLSWLFVIGVMVQVFLAGLVVDRR